MGVSQSVQSLSCVQLWSYESKHARPPCPSPTTRVHPNPCPLSWWCHPTILSSVVSFSSCPQSFSASESFQMSQLFTSGGQSIGVSASTSVLPVNTQNWSPLGWTDWISLQSKGLSRVFSNTTVQPPFLQVKEMEPKETMTCPGSPAIFTRKNSDLLTLHPDLLFFSSPKKKPKRRVKQSQLC